MRQKVYNYKRIGGIMGASAVLMGAVGNHFFKKIMSEEDYPIYQLAVQYHFFHALALIFVGFMIRRNNTSSSLNNAGKLFFLGTTLFSGSLYLLTLIRTMENESLDLLGVLTPFGGVMLIIGWLLLAFDSRSAKNKQTSDIEFEF